MLFYPLPALVSDLDSSWEDDYGEAYNYYRKTELNKYNRVRNRRAKLYNVQGTNKELPLRSFVLEARAAAKTEADMKENYFTETFLRSLIHHRFHVVIGGDVSCDPIHMQVGVPIEQSRLALMEKVQEAVRSTGKGRSTLNDHKTNAKRRPDKRKTSTRQSENVDRT